MATNSGGYDNERRFTLFPNKRKVEGDKKPNYTGTITLNAVDYWLSAWIQSPKQGGPKYLQGVIGDPKDATQPAARAPSGAGANFKVPHQRPANPAPQNPFPEQPAEPFKDDDIPF